jgi:SAM-dependent methyltransferase
MYPILNDSDLKMLYDTSYLKPVSEGFEETPQTNECENSSKGWKYSLGYLKSCSEKPLKVLDFGCGPNSPLLRLARELGHHAIGVEFEAEVCEIAEKNTGVMVQSYSEFLNSDELYDFVFLGDVLEHLSPPEKTIEILKGKLELGGKLVIQGPLEGGFSIFNLALGILARMSGRETDQPPFHVSFANMNSLEKLMRSHGMHLDYRKISHVYWPAPGPRELLNNFSLRGLILFILQFSDAIASKMIKNYGNRFFLVASIK